jgi:phosphoserine phosphatase RsbU/P
MQGRVREIALELRTAEGGRLPVLVNAVLERFPGGEPRVARLAVFDATERRGYERELLDAKQRAESSEARAMALARTLQQTLIPPALPTVAGLEVAGAYRPAGDGSEVGGDFYDVFQVDEETWIVVVGDVRGKGAEAAVVTALARYTIRALAVQTQVPSEIIARLNQALLAQDVDRYCTVVVLALRRSGRDWAVTFCLGGHPQPVLQDLDAGARMLGTFGPLVGALPSPAWTDCPLTLRPGQLLLLYTDGVTEARRGREFFGDDRMLASVGRHGSSAHGLVAGLVDEVLDFQGGSASDDIAVVSLGVPG